MSRSRASSFLFVVGLVAATVFGWAYWTSGCATAGTAVLGLYRERWFLANVALSYLTVWAAVFLLFRPRRRFLERSLAVHFGLGLLLVAAEALAAFGLVDFRFLTATDHLHAKADAPPDPRLRWATQPDLRVKGETVPSFKRVMGVDADPIPFEFQTDRFGFRNPTDKAGARVICIGDSMVVAGLVPIAETMTERLETVLGVSVMNAGEVAYSPPEELIRLGATGMDLDGKLILHFVFEGNDLADCKKWRSWNARATASEWPKSGLLKNTLALLHRPKSCAAELRYGLLPLANGAKEKVYFWLEGTSHLDELQGLERELAEGSRKLRAVGADYAIVLVPTKLSAMLPSCEWPETTSVPSPADFDNPLPKALARFCEREDIPYLDLTDGLRDFAARGVLTYFTKDEHMNSTGQRAMAEILAPWIREKWLD